MFALMKKEVLENPYDFERDMFVSQIRKEVPYFENLDVKELRELYYLSEERFVKYDEVLFQLGERCNGLYMIINGWIDIIITDGYDFN